jgi:hypothetical protein
MSVFLEFLNNMTIDDKKSDLSNSLISMMTLQGVEEL